MCSYEVSFSLQKISFFSDLTFFLDRSTTDSEPATHFEDKDMEKS